jgi:hypothetical protein
MVVQEAFGYQVLAANSSTTLFTTQGLLAGFYATTAGSIEVRRADDTVILPVHAVSVGWNNMPLALAAGCKIVLSGGCAGTAFTG